MSAVIDKSSLLAQLQGATEGSADLEGRMWCEAHGKIFISAHEMDHFKPSWVQCSYRDKPRGGEQVTRAGDIMRWTRNLQDAVSLVPEGLEWRVGGNPTAIKYAGEAELADPVTGSWQFPVEATGATPALALCIAIIKAKSA